jgi:two-component system cell cycle sensor histidine kinase/response regulator CckA
MLRATLPSTIEVKYMIPRKLPAVVADPIQIHQVVMNLCANAAHAMREKGGILQVSLEEVTVDESMTMRDPDLMPGRYQRLKVSDTGHGMSPEVVERIFDPFFSTKGPGEGTGLGLSVVHGIVKKHGGGIDVKSTPGEGTTFEIFFPSLEEMATEPDQEAEVLPTGNERILLVDDETSMAEMERDMLESLGYRVTARTSSVEALKAFRARPDQFDLVVTDMTMPLMTGAEFSRKILALRPDMPIILCTGFSERIQEETAKSIGVREFVMKPIILRDIAHIIRRALALPTVSEKTAV